MNLFTGLKQIRELQKVQIAFLPTLVDFDIVIEIGYAEEQGEQLTPKQLLLLNLSSRTTIRRKLANLINLGMVIRRPDTSDHRSSFLMVSSQCRKLLTKYGEGVTAISASHFK